MKLYHLILTLSTILVYPHHSFTQVNMRKLPPNINQPSVNLYAPVISGDGETLVYLSDYTDDGHHSMNFSTKKTVSSWNEPVEVSKLVNRPTLNYRGGYCLSFDGDMLIFSSRKSGLGGFELWYSYRDGDNWGAPANFGRPINSATNEGTPSISPDGQYLYFMRCDGMTEYKGAKGCTLYVSKKKYNKWQEPEPLPSNINTGNSQNPKILADNETLIFSSDQFGGKGGLDLYMSKKNGDLWSEPIPMDFINTEKDDQHISIPAKGRYLFTSQNTGKDFGIVQLLIPDEFKPKGVMRIQGKVVDQVTGDPVEAQLTVFNVNARDRIWNDRIDEKGEFTLVLNEGDIYDLSLNHPDGSHKYFSKIYNLETLGKRDKEKLNIKLSPLEIGEEYETSVFFNQYSSDIADGAIYELRRLSDIIRKNPSIRLEVIATQNNYLEDSIQSSEDLTEVIIDSVMVNNDRSRENASVNAQELASEKNNMSLDSLNTEGSAKYTTPEILMIKYTYHNDRSEAQANAVKNYLVEHGANEENITIRGYKEKSSLEEDENSETIKIKILSF